MAILLASMRSGAVTDIAKLGGASLRRELFFLVRARNDCWRLGNWLRGHSLSILVSARVEVTCVKSLKVAWCGITSFVC